MIPHEKINYVELPSRDINATRAFFSEAFGWQFAEYGEEYYGFTNAGLHGGFYLSELSALTDHGSALVVLYSLNLDQSQEKVINAGGSICKPVFSFPGGKRFHFIEPGGNEFAVWSDR